MIPPARPTSWSAPPSACDYAVVGGGIIGLAVARALGRRYPSARIVLFEREHAVGLHQTGHNSGVIHRGVYYRPGSAKARLCVRGSRQMVAYCQERGVNVREVGKLVVAVSPRQLPALDALEARARANGVPIRRVDAGGIRKIEPRARGIEALHSPTTAIVDFGEVARVLADELIEMGVHMALACPIVEVVPGRSGLTLVHCHGSTVADRAVFCAGGWADQFMRDRGDIRIVPFRGRYLRVRPNCQDMVRGLVYPVPDPGLPFLGVHLTRHIDNHVSVGPTALPAMRRNVFGGGLKETIQDFSVTVMWPGVYRMAWQQRSSAAREARNALSRRAVIREAAKLVPITVSDVEPGSSGIRAQAVHRSGALVDDFVFAQEGRAIHVRNAPSPAATASLAIAEVIADRIGGSVA